MKTSKRLLSLLLAVVMVVTTCSVGMSAFAADKSDDVFTYVTDEGKAVDITYESLNNLVNTYAPEIIKLINKDGKLTDLGVDVDAVCASEKPIYELLAQLSPTLIQLMSGSNGDSDEVIKAVLLDAGAIRSDLADQDKERAMRLVYAQYTYLADDDAAMSIWSLYKFCMDNANADNKDLKKYCNDTKDVLKPLILAFSKNFRKFRFCGGRGICKNEYYRQQCFPGKQLCKPGFRFVLCTLYFERTFIRQIRARPSKRCFKRMRRTAYRYSGFFNRGKENSCKRQLLQGHKAYRHQCFERQQCCGIYQ